MDLALNNLQSLICHKTQTTNQPTHTHTHTHIYIYYLWMFKCLSFLMNDISMHKKKKKKKRLSIEFWYVTAAYLIMRPHSLLPILRTVYFLFALQHIILLGHLMPNLVLKKGVGAERSVVLQFNCRETVWRKNLDSLKVILMRIVLQ